MHVSFLPKTWMIIRLLAVSLKGALLVIFGSYFAKNKRSCFDNIVHSWALRVLSIIRVKYRIINPDSFEFEANRPYVIISNHLSHLDIPLIYTAFPNDSVGMFAKKELFRIPLWGRGMKLSGCVSIDRENKRQAIRDIATAKEVMLSGVRIWIAPEGTRSRNGKMGEFKTGGFKIAMATKAIILPVTIIGSNKALPSKTLDFSTDEEVEVHIGKPIDSTKYSRQDLKQLIADTVSEIESKLR